MAFTWCVFAATAIADESGLDLVAPAKTWSDGRLQVSTGIDFRPGDEPLEALDSGVALVISLQARASRVHGFIARERYRRERQLEIRYLPLSRYYQLRDLESGDQESYPRLSMLFDELRRARTLELGLESGEAEAARWQVQVRARLDISSLPSPMRLPAWLSGQWRLGSRWHTWRLEED